MSIECCESIRNGRKNKVTVFAGDLPGIGHQRTRHQALRLALPHGFGGAARLYFTGCELSHQVGRSREYRIPVPSLQRSPLFVLP